MNRVIAEPYNIPVPRSPQENPSISSSENFLSGLITDEDPVNIPPSALQVLQNGIYTRNLLIRRNGLSIYSLTKPNSQKVMAMYAFSSVNEGVNLIRFSPTTIYKATSAGWVEFTAASEALAGTVNDYLSFATLSGRAFFSNWGANHIMELLPSTNEYEVLGNAEKYKYITGAFNRVIGAYANGITQVPYQIGWSGNLNPDEWDPLVDISAGSIDLVSSPSDISDDITGLFNLASVLCVTRQRSIWLATNQPSATDPFSFFVAVPRIGCDVPRTIILAADGIIFYNFQTSTVYFYVPGAQPEDISGPIKRYLKSLISSPNELFATFNFDTNSYTLFVSNNNNSTVIGFTFNFRSKTWSTETYQNISSCIDIDYASSNLTIDELVGTIADLEGSIDELGGLVANSNRFFGSLTGELYTQPFFSGFEDQVDNIVDDDDGTTYETVLCSKTIITPVFNQYINYLVVTVTPYKAGSITLSYSKDDGQTYTAVKTVTFDSSDIFISQLVTMRKLVNCRKIIWKVSTSDCMCAVNRFDIQTYPSGVSRS